LGNVASSFCNSGTGLQSGQVTSATSHGKAVVSALPSFVLTFIAPQLALISSMACSMSSVPIRASQVSNAFSLTSQSLLMEQLFMAGPGFSPVLLKLVSQIDIRKYVDLSDFLAANMVCLDPKKKTAPGWLACPCYTAEETALDLTSWTEAFTGANHLFPAAVE